MAQFLRGKQSGIQSDLSSGLTPELFALDYVARYGINSQIAALAYDPVQSLLAVGTNESQYGSGQVYVFGQKRVSVTLSIPKRASIRTLQFCADKLVCVDSKNDVIIFSLEGRCVLAAYSPPGRITALLTDPTIDYALIGLQNGDVLAYDLDRMGLAPFKISNIWRERNPKAKMVSVVTLALHPRDIGTLMVGYSEGVVLFSFKQNKALSFLQYEPHPEMGTRFPSVHGHGIPKLVQAVWHPNGTFILTAHDDSTFAIWDSKNGKMLVARTVEQGTTGAGSTPGTFSPNSPLFRVAWCSKPNPDDTGILIAGGVPMNSFGKNLTFLDFGTTPVYATSSWQILTSYFETPKSQHTLPTPPNTEVVDFCIIPRKSPHYAGGHDPIAIIALLASGELVTMSFPSGHPITPTNQLHPSITFVHPFVNHLSLACIQRTRWLAMKENRIQGLPLLVGGAEQTHPLKRYEDRNVIQTAHADGIIRLWDAGHGDEVENDAVLQVDIARALGRTEDVDVVVTSISGATSELAVGMRSGEVAVFRYDRNTHFGQDVEHVRVERFGLEDISDRAEPSVKVGLLPLTLLSKTRGSVSALKISDVGFVVAGFEDGSIITIDLRGPAVVYEANLQDFTKSSGRGSIRRSMSTPSQNKADWPTAVEFGVMSLEGEDYSSILFFVGTCQGRFLTFKILPQPNGSYGVQTAGMINLDDKVISISPLVAESGQPAYASQSTVSGLRNGLRVNGVVLAVTQAGARIFKPAIARGASKTWHDILCYSACVVRYDDDRGCGLVALFGDGSVRTYSIPGLKEIASVDISKELDPKRFPDAVITPTGDIFGWTGPSEVIVLNPWGSGQDTTCSADRLFNPEALIPPRPTISNIQWISGTQHVTPSDLDVLLGGPDRPPSKRLIEQMRSEEVQRRTAERTPGATVDTSGSKDEGYWAYMQRQVQERTERLNFMGDSMDKLEETSAGWADDVSKFVSQQKKKAVMGMIGSKFGF